MLNLSTDANRSTDTKANNSFLYFFIYYFMGGGASEFPSYIVSEFSSFQVKGGREGGPMRGLGADHVISWPMKYLIKCN